MSRILIIVVPTIVILGSYFRFFRRR